MCFSEVSRFIRDFAPGTSQPKIEPIRLASASSALTPSFSVTAPPIRLNVDVVEVEPMPCCDNVDGCPSLAAGVL